MVLVKLQIWNDEGKKLAITLDKKKRPANRLRSKFRTWANETISLYKASWQAKDIDDVPITIFNEIHKPKIDTFNESINFISLNKAMYITYKIRCMAIFDKLNTLLIETKVDFLEICTQKNFNGRLNGLKYKGIPLSDKEYSEFILKDKKD